MREHASKLLLGVEMTILLAPVSYIAGLYLVLLASIYSSDASMPASADAHVVPMLVLLASCALLSGWWACLAFLLHGRTGLPRLHPVAVFATRLGGVMAIIGGASMAASFIWLQASPVFDMLGVLAFGMPALVPLLHLEIERHCRRRAVV